MRPIVLVLFLVVLIAAVFLLKGRLGHGMATSTTTTNSIPTTTISIRTNTTSSSSMILGAEDAGLGYGYVASTGFGNNRSVLSADMNMLYDTGASAIRMDIGYDAWLHNDSETMATYDYFVNDVRSHGKIFIIADAAAESYRNNKLSWSDFKTAWVQRVKMLAARYHPDYYIVVKEPPWYFPMIQGSPFVVPLNASDWANLTARLAATVKLVSPNTKIGVAVDEAVYHQKRGSLDLEFMQDAEEIQNISFIGFDIYTANGTSSDVSRFLNEVGTGGKKVWLAEAWSRSTPLYNQSYEASDAAWIKSLYSFALSKNITAIIPFYTNFFASYSPKPSTPAELISYYQGRTPVFYAYKNITALVQK